jgi:hypothetical protein
MKFVGVANNTRAVVAKLKTVCILFEQIQMRGNIALGLAK